jgi:hypothetical protein
MIDADLMRLIILHYHIFRNAGSTIEDILDHCFGERFAMLDTPAGEGLISNPDLVRFLDARPNLCAFSSHQIRHPLPEAPGYLFFDICFLRDPIDRIRSIYTYFRKRPNPADPLSDLANRATLGDFIAGMIQDFPLFVKDVQVNLLACGGDSDEPEPRDLDLAIQRMLATSFLGLVDCFDQSAANVSDRLRGTVASRTENLRQACSPEVYEELLRLNSLDRVLVDRARAEVLRRFQQIPRRTARPIQRAKRRSRQPAPALRLRSLPGCPSQRRGPRREPTDRLPAVGFRPSRGPGKGVRRIYCRTRKMRLTPFLDPAQFICRDRSARVPIGVMPPRPCRRFARGFRRLCGP